MKLNRDSEFALHLAEKAQVAIVRDFPAFERE